MTKILGDPSSGRPICDGLLVTRQPVPDTGDVDILSVLSYEFRNRISERDLEIYRGSPVDRLREIAVRILFEFYWSFYSGMRQKLQELERDMRYATVPGRHQEAVYQNLRELDNLMRMTSAEVDQLTQAIARELGITDEVQT